MLRGFGGAGSAWHRAGVGAVPFLKRLCGR